jgi:hypothetical protein
MSKTKDADLARLVEIADLLDERELLFDERCVIWDRRIIAGDCAVTNQPKDRGQSELARVSRVARAQVVQGVLPERLEKARSSLKAARKSGS